MVATLIAVEEILGVLDLVRVDSSSLLIGPPTPTAWSELVLQLTPEFWF